MENTRFESRAFDAAVHTDSCRALRESHETSFSVQIVARRSSNKMLEIARMAKPGHG